MSCREILLNLITVISFSLNHNTCDASSFRLARLVNFGGIGANARSQTKSSTRPLGLKDYPAETFGDNVLNVYEGAVGALNSTLVSAKDNTGQQIKTVTNSINKGVTIAKNIPQVAKEKAQSTQKSIESTVSYASKFPQRVKEKAQSTQESVGTTVRQTASTIKSIPETVVTVPAKMQNGITKLLTPPEFVVNAANAIGNGIATTGQGLGTIANAGIETTSKIPQILPKRNSDGKRIVVLQSNDGQSFTRVFTDVKDGIYSILESLPEVGKSIGNAAKVPVEVVIQAPKNLGNLIKQPFVVVATGFYITKNAVYDFIEIFNEENASTRKERARQEALKKAEAMEAVLEAAKERKRLQGQRKLEAQEAARRRSEAFNQAKETVYMTIDNAKGTVESIKMVPNFATNTAQKIAIVPSVVQGAVLGVQQSVGKAVTTITLVPGKVKASINSSKDTIIKTASSIQGFPAYWQDCVSYKINQTQQTASDLVVSAQSFSDNVINMPGAIGSSVSKTTASVQKLQGDVTLSVKRIGETVAGAPNAVAKSVSKTTASVKQLGANIAGVPSAVGSSVSKTSVSIKRFGQNVAGIPSAVGVSLSKTATSVQQFGESVAGIPSVIKSAAENIITIPEKVQTSIQGSFIVRAGKGTVTAFRNSFAYTRSALENLMQLPDAIARKVYSPIYEYKQRSDKVATAVRAQELEQKLKRAKDLEERLIRAQDLEARLKQAEAKIEALPKVEAKVGEYVKQLEKVDVEAQETLVKLEQYMDRLEKISKDISSK